MIGRADADGVDVVAGDDFAEIVVGSTVGVGVLFVHDLFGFLAEVLIDVADCEHLDFGFF